MTGFLEASNEIFLVSDGEDLSTTELIQSIANTLNSSIFLIPVPERVLWVVAVLVGRKAFLQRLCGSLQVDILKARNLLGWKPQISIDEGLRRLVRPLQRDL